MNYYAHLYGLHVVWAHPQLFAKKLTITHTKYGQAVIYTTVNSSMK